MITGAVLVAAAFSTVACSTAKSTPRPATPLPVVYDNYQGAKVMPSSLGGATTEGGSSFMVRLHWLRWEGSDAIARGTLELNSCVPDCAQGRPVDHPETVTLSQPRIRGGVRYFSRMTWTGTCDYRPFIADPSGGWRQGGLTHPKQGCW